MAQGIASTEEIAMRDLNAGEVETVYGGDAQSEPPPPGVTLAQWNDLLFRLEWEKKNGSLAIRVELT